MSKVSIKDLLKNPELYNSDNCYGFHDWFCSKQSLKGRFNRMLPRIKALVSNGSIDAANTYVWFKNNAPISGGTYDDMRFSTINDRTYIGGISFNNDGTASYWLSKEGFEVHPFQSWRELKKNLSDIEFEL